MSEDQKKLLEQQLWNIANTLRGKMDADEFRDYILGFIFYKYLAERMELYANTILKQDKIKYREIKEKSKEGKEYIEAIKEEALEKLGYFLKPSELFSEIAKRGNGSGDKESGSKFILEDLQKILNNIQLSTMGTASEEDFDHLFEDIDLNSTKLGKSPDARNEVIAKVLAHLDKIDFKLEQTELDVLGDAYEYLIGQFASGAGKKAGEFYTPQEVSKVLAKIVTTGKTKLKSVYDPTCGSGSLLLRVAKEVKDVGTFYGQELNRTTYNLARMNMIMHGVHYRKFDIKQEDTLEHPQHLGKQFEAIVANPPFSAKWSANALFSTDDRFSQYGRLAPSSKADFAFVQHMIHHLSENGTMAIVLPHGALFRSGAEQHIRKYIIENKNYLDAVIGLPANIFYGTNIPTCILVFKKCREEPGDVLFIDASKGFEKIKTQNALRDIDINKIIHTYKNRSDEENYSRKVKLAEIANNDYNLNIPRYIDNYESDDSLDINLVCDIMIRARDSFNNNEQALKSICNALKIPFPPFNNLSLLRAYKKSVSQNIFSQKVRFLDIENKPYPDWEWKFGNEIFESLSNKSHNSELPILAITQEYGAVPRDLIDYQISVSDKSVEGYKVVEKGDFIISLRSFQGGIEYSNYTGICSPAYIILRPIVPVDKIFFKHFFKSSFYIRELGKKLEGIRDGKMISFKYFSEIKLPIPCMEEQQQIAKLFTAIDNKISSISIQIDNINEWESGLLGNFITKQ
ncbi:type I restriction-modification system subunit M [Flavihumibacter sp. RY-1]|uniref:site-specific DNA-methyltransferase (adenine-specific) n=1 Tax=Flavihumibacter fluminis TaxID=2909236 RepID=A0ABS9BIJ7_9BACT|nr:type I restriction-modification system subunit M [Flavihumibacter fluminis]MCF1715397.1 type I restriction-modification system subunit M [Flavihumibacter fluminis]